MCLRQQDETRFEYYGFENSGDFGNGGTWLWEFTGRHHILCASGATLRYQPPRPHRTSKPAVPYVNVIPNDDDPMSEEH